MIALEREQHAQDRDMRLAWTVASLSRTDKLPKMETLLTKTNRPQTVEEQRASIAAIVAQYGLKTKRVRMVWRQANAG